MDNSARSTNSNRDAKEWNGGVNKNACEDTEDSLFLLSAQEATKKEYGFKANPLALDKGRRKQPTDYASAQGAYKSNLSDYEGNGYWRLRSPADYDVAYTYGVLEDGNARFTIVVSDTYGSVAPAVKIKRG